MRVILVITTYGTPIGMVGIGLGGRMGAGVLLGNDCIPGTGVAGRGVEVGVAATADTRAVCMNVGVGLQPATPP